MQLLLFVSVATATTALEATGASPVQKVVKLLEDIKVELEQEAEKDQENYEKLACWCATNDKAKTQAIKDNTARLAELKSEIEERQSKDQKLAQSIEKGTAEVAQLKDSLDGAEKQRAKDGEENHDTEVELTKNVASLKGAIIVLKKHQETAFPQLSRRMSFLQGVGSDAADKLGAWMDQNQYAPLTDEQQQSVERSVDGFMGKQQRKGQYTDDEVSVLQSAKQLLSNFLQGSEGYTPKYEPQSGEIFGILTTLKEQLEEDLKETQEREAKQASEFADMSAALGTQISEAEKMLNAQSEEKSANAKALADATEEQEDKSRQLEDDTKFLKRLKEMCGKLDEDWEVRAKTRKDEMLAVSEALEMLVGDDARDTFAGNTPNSTVPTGGVQAFVQLSASDARAKAAALLTAAGKKAGNQMLLALGESAKLDAFTKVKKAITDMISALKTQQSDEVKHKDFCKGELQQLEMETMDANHDKEDLETSIESLTGALETVVNEIKADSAELQDTQVGMQQANVNRVEEAQEFQKEVENQRAVRKILAKVKARLNEFYQRQALLQGKATQPQDPSQPVMPGSVGEYKDNGSSASVIVMLDTLIGDAMKAEVEAIKTENDAVQEYGEFVTTSQATMSALEKTIVNKRQLKAETEKSLEQAQADLESKVEDLELLSKTTADTHKQCDFVLKNFDARQKARGEEIEALNQAMAALSGAA